MDDLSTWKPDTGKNTCTIGVDGYNWMYKVIRSCTKTSGVAAEIENKFMKKVYDMRRWGFTLYIVFDGFKLPIKDTIKSKGKDRQKVLDSHKATDVGAGDNDNKRGSSVTFANVFSVTERLKRENIKFMVAPYEADPQLAFLLREEHIDIILTGDADLILYGCRKIIFDYEGGYYDYDSSKLKGSKLFGGFTEAMVLQACMLSGCDYLSNLPGVSLNRAIDVMKKEMISLHDYLEVLEALKPTNVDLGQKLDYIAKFIKAMKTYRHQRVYNPTNKTVVCLTPFSDETKEDLQPYIGPQLTFPSPITIEDFVNGNIDPVTNTRREPSAIIMGGYVYSEVNLIGEDELQINLKMESLFRATSTLKDLQKAMLNAAQDHIITQRRQILKDTKLMEACHNVLGKAGASFKDMSNKKKKEAEDYVAGLEEMVIKPLNGLIDDKSLQDARNQAESYSQTRQEAEIRGDSATLDKLNKLFQTSSLKTHEDLSLVKEDHRKKTFKILVHLSKSDSSHWKKLADILAATHNETI